MKGTVPVTGNAAADVGFRPSEYGGYIADARQVSDHPNRGRISNPPTK